MYSANCRTRVPGDRMVSLLILHLLDPRGATPALHLLRPQSDHLERDGDQLSLG